MSYQSQRHGDYPTGYTTHLQTQQPIDYQNYYQDDYQGDYSDESSDESPEESSEGSSDEYSDEDPERYLNGSQEDHPLGFLDEPSAETPSPAESHINSPTGQSIENPSRYFYGISDTHQAQGGYFTAGTAPDTAFEDLGLINPSLLEARPILSGPAMAVLTEYPEIGGVKPPPFPHPDSNPYGAIAQNITGFEIPGSEPPYSMADVWWVRMSVANDRSLDEMAEELRRSTTSVLNVIEKDKLPWTPLQDSQLREMKVDEHSVMPAIMQNLIGSEYRYVFEVLARAQYLALVDDFARQVAHDDTLQDGSEQYPMGILLAEPVMLQASRDGVAETYQAKEDDGHQRVPKQYPMVLQPVEPGPSQANDGVTAGISQVVKDPKPWGRDEVRKLAEWVARYPHSWTGVEMELPGRTPVQCSHKWNSLGKNRKARLQLSQEAEEAIQASIRNGLENLKKEDLDFIKLRLAQGLATQTIRRESYRGFRERTIIKFVYFAGWLPWTPQEDWRLGQMQEGQEWSEISKQFRNPLRSKEEVDARLEYVSQAQPPGKDAPPYKFDAEDDKYISLGLARGMRLGQILKEEFPDLQLTTLLRRATRIEAMWSANDDRRLRDENPGAGWRSIGQKYAPPRDAAVVEARWDYIHSEEYAKDPWRNG